MSIHAKLLAIQSKLHVPKNQKNSFGNYNYRSCEDILEALKPLLNEQGLTLVIFDSIELVGTRFYVKATVQVGDGTSESVSVTAYAREEETKKGMDGAQITGSASSYARKYALNGLFCIDDTKDSDSMDNAPKAPARAPNAPAKPVTKPAVPPPAPAKDESSPALAIDITEIARLCKETKTDHAKMFDFYKVKNAIPTKGQAQIMLKVLRDRLDNQIDEAAKANS